MTALVTYCVAFSPQAAFADSFDALRVRWAETIVADKAKVDPSDPVIVNGLKEITALGQKHWNSMNKQAGRTYLWSDLTNTEDSAEVTKAYQFLHAIAVAVQYDSYPAAVTKLTNAAQAKRDLIGALDWMFVNRYQNNAYKAGNWFDWEIGAPQVLLNIVALVWDDLTPTQRDNYTKAVLAKVKPGLDYYGANGAWQTKIWALVGVLRKNSNYLADAQARVNNVLAVPFTSLPGGTNTKSGMYADGSFIEHYRHAYNGGYGASYLSNLVNVLYLLKGSSWEPNLGNVTNHVVPWVFDAYDFSMYKRMFFHSVKGRYVGRVDQNYDAVADGSGVGQAVTRLIEVTPFSAERERLRKVIREWNDSNTSASHLVQSFVASSIHDYSHAIQFVYTITPRGPLNAYKQYPWMNRAMVHRPGWAASVAMYNRDDVRGTRLLTLSNETLQKETLQGLHLSDGTLQVMNDDFGQYNSDYFRRIDWTRLPGTTVAYGYGIPLVTPPGAAPAWEERHSNQSNWAGGASADEFGVTGFQLNPTSTQWYGHLHARKAWFFFDKEIVCLGADIRTTDGSETHPIQTVIENWKLNQAGTNAFTVNGSLKPTTLGWTETMESVSWASLEGMVPGTDMGYYLPTPGRIFGLRENRSGVKFMTLWADHGASQSARSYGYVLLPNHNAAQTQAYAASAPLTVLENSPNAQAVRKASIGVTGALFLKDQIKTITLPNSTASAMKSDRNAAVMVHVTPGNVKIGISDPTWENTGTISLEIWPVLTGNVTKLVSKDARITVLQTAPTLKLAVNVKDAQGDTLTASFTATP
ncbi:polysaccharide lyase family 8 super-sandwich domain-containing protein [Stigmatella sp. ncwal1]|uniref:Polysaccharide lyase family 8 super-sandwich domain-containing protein n=1 Tax=Stigmatella ashevillensis TaxID=2995309 RepID=A0ABT5DNS2_9BACT|nr:polysaccharide lyase family 8 super-sandwich domain-containing protein [Stigmatella ashevillena]MDC0714778.1 polysaccharide lyase family 8 super-sandwich domain-containing protein [Stigmatella ashevillena]